MNRFVLLSLDVEEFDIPLEYDFSIKPDEQMEVGKRGLDAVMPVIEANQIECTMFTTANFALHYPDAIKKIARHHEIASHTFYHSSFNNGDLQKSREVLEEISGNKVTGLRMPLMRKINPGDILEAGYKYDSSVNPTIIPGRYNNLNSPRTIHKQKGLWHIPTTVSPVLRLPLFWLAFKNYPYNFFKRICLKCLKVDGYIVLYFHPWEFTNIKNYNLPAYVTKYCGQRLLQRFDKLIKELKSDCKFMSMQNFIEKN